MGTAVRVSVLSRVGLYGGTDNHPRISQPTRKNNRVSPKTSVLIVVPVTLIILRSPSFRFWSGRKNKNIRGKSKQAYCAEMVLGSFVFLPCDSAVRIFDSEIQTNAECTLLGTGLQVSKPTLRLWSGREETCRGASRGLSFLQSIRAQHESCCSVCTLA